jgi:HAD superfamily hydrolase (TIGR01509 family)
MSLPARCVLFDLGNVLIRFDYEPAIRDMADATGLAVEQIRERVFDSGLCTAGEDGSLSAEAFLAQIGEALAPARLSSQEIADIWCGIFSANPGVESVLNRVRVPKYLLSNIGPVHWAFLANSGPAQHFRDRAFLSYELKEVKPNPAIYHAVLSQMGEAPGDILFVDDRPENRAAAEAMGFRTAYYDAWKMPSEVLGSILDAHGALASP